MFFFSWLFPSKEKKLLKAIKKGNLDEVKILISFGVNLNYKSGTPKSPLAVAVKNNNIDMINTLINSGAVVTDGNELIPAVINDNREIAGLLIQKGANPNAVRKRGKLGLGKESMLMSAAASGNPQMVRMLIDSGADLQFKNNRNSTALHCAVYSNKADVVDMLLTAGMKPDANEVNLLMAAINHGNKEIVQSLIKAGMNVNERSDTDKTPLIRAVDKGHAPIVRALLNAGADPNMVCGDVIALWCINRLNFIQDDVKKYFKAAGWTEELDISRLMSYTAISAAAVDGKIEVLKLLLGVGANPYYKWFFYNDDMKKAYVRCFKQALIKQKESDKDASNQYTDCLVPIGPKEQFPLICIGCGCSLQSYSVIWRDTTISFTYATSIIGYKVSLPVCAGCSNIKPDWKDGLVHHVHKNFAGHFRI